MSFFAKLYKSQEAARERNRREQRRSDLFKFGTDYIERYHLAALERERRLVQNEFDRIRKEIQNSPKIFIHGNSARARFTNDAHAQEETEDDNEEYRNESELTSYRNRETPKDEIGLYDTMLFFRNNPSVLLPILSVHGQDGNLKEKVDSRTVPSVTNDDSDSYVPFYLRPDYDPSYGSLRTESVKKYAILLRQNTPPGYTRGRHGTLHRKNLDLLTLARHGMQSARENISHRLGGSDADSHDGHGDDQPDARKPKLTKANAPSQQVIDPSRYTADGELRKVHQLPDSDWSWDQARNCYYVRHPKENAQEASQLNIKEIFAKD